MKTDPETDSHLVRVCAVREYGTGHSESARARPPGMPSEAATCRALPAEDEQPAAGRREAVTVARRRRLAADDGGELRPEARGGVEHEEVVEVLACPRSGTRTGDEQS